MRSLFDPKSRIFSTLDGGLSKLLLTGMSSLRSLQ